MKFLNKEEKFILQTLYSVQKQDNMPFMTLEDLSSAISGDPELKRNSINRLVSKGYLYWCKDDAAKAVYVAFSEKGAEYISSKLSWVDIASSSIDGLDIMPFGYASTETFAESVSLSKMVEERIKQAQENGEIKTGVDEEGNEIQYIDINLDNIKDEMQKAMDNKKNMPKDEWLNKLEKEFLDKKEQPKEKNVLESPKQIKAFLDENIYNQEDAKIAAATLLYNHNRGIRKNILFVGPSGCGKTEIFRSLNKIYKNIYIFDASNITSDGWKGSKKSFSVFEEMANCGFSKYEIEHSIIVFDEFDKLCTPQFTATGENVSANVQGEMLSLIEGRNISTGHAVINTSNISFVFLGAFENLFKKQEKEERGLGFGNELRVSKTLKPISMQDVIDYGMRTEVAGRITSITQLSPLKEEDFYKILNDEKISPIERLEKQYGFSLNLTDEKLHEIAKEAVDNKMGARFINSKIQDLYDKEIFERDGFLVSDTSKDENNSKDGSSDEERKMSEDEMERLINNNPFFVPLSS